MATTRDLWETEIREALRKSLGRRAEVMGRELVDELTEKFRKQLAAMVAEASVEIMLFQQVDRIGSILTIQIELPSKEG